MIARPPAGWRERAARAVARGERLDAFLPPLLRDSPISLRGYWWGTTVGFVWGGLWSQGRVERRAGLWVFRGLPNWAFGRGGVCVGGCYLTGSAPVTDAVLAGELPLVANNLAGTLTVATTHLYEGFYLAKIARKG